MERTICFTGRRPKNLCGYDQAAYNQFVGSLAGWLKQFLAPNGKTQFISGGAQGFDQLAFWAVDLLKNSSPDLKNAIVNTVYVPFKGQQSVWKKSGLFSKDQYDAMIQQADRVAYLHEAVQDRKTIIGLLMERNHRMVDSSDMVIALYPGDDWHNKETSGGTGECMRYAEENQKPLRQLKYTIQNGQLIGLFT